MFTGSIIDAPEIPVKFVAGDRALPVPEQAHSAFEQLEQSLGSIRGRKFYGVVSGGEYRACVAIQPNEPADSTPVYLIPGGRYYCHRIDGFLGDPSRIGQLAEDLIARSDFDSSRPVVEFYRGHDKLSLRVPVK